MTVKKIIPCVCIDHTPITADSVYYGMPQLKVNNGIDDHKQFWTAFCPACGRGGVLQETSSYKALKKWNEMQTRLWESERNKSVFEDEQGTEDNLRCDRYAGVTCVYEGCPIAKIDEHKDHGYPPVRKCKECPNYKGCWDCALNGTEYCDKST